MEYLQVTKENKEITNSGSLLMDATCCPADVAFPQDFQLLNKAREKLEQILADICRTNSLRNRKTVSWCRERHIQLTGPSLGHPPKNKDKRKEARRQEYQDICDRNSVLCSMRDA